VLVVVLSHPTLSTVNGITWKICYVSAKSHNETKCISCTKLYNFWENGCSITAGRNVTQGLQVTIFEKMGVS
jgi:hypothetical protein